MTPRTSRADQLKRMAARGALPYALCVLSMLTGPAYGAWREIERRDAYRVVIIDEADVRKVPVYWDALRQVCKNDFCNVIFFSQGTSIPGPKARLSSEDLGRALLIYTTNKGFAWNCGVHPNADNCFRW